MTKLAPDVEQALNELDNAERLGGDTSAALKRLNAAGYDSRGIAAARRSRAAGDQPDAVTTPPADRSSRPAAQQTTAAAPATTTASAGPIQNPSAAKAADQGTPKTEA